MAEGIKNDVGKDPWHLVPWDAVRGIVKVLGFGANKYADRNWELGMDWSRPYGALIRHLTAWWEGEKADPETGYSHLWHAGCCIFFLIAYEIRGVGRDDRPSVGVEIVPVPMQQTTDIQAVMIERAKDKAEVCRTQQQERVDVRRTIKANRKRRLI